MLFGGYRRGDANDPDLYVASIAAVLALYEPDVIREVTDPRTGISQSDYMEGRFRSFMPNSGELKAYCDDVVARRARIARYATLPRTDLRRLPKPQSREPGSRATLRVLQDAPGYAAMVEWAATADPLDYRYDQGTIWVPFGIYDAHRHKSGSGPRRFTADDVRAMEQAAAPPIDE